MNPSNYSLEEQKDIEERVKKAQEVLKELQLFPTAQVIKVNLGDDVFADKIIAYLQDAKYNKEPIKSPLQPDDLEKN